MKMTYLLVRHKVEDFAQWKAVFDEHGAARKAGGSQGAQVLRNVNDPSEQVIITEWPDLDHARNFAGSPDLRQAMQRAGVIGMPDIIFLEEAERQPA
jgi:heme-degrading monooxygenase HmoA